MRAILVAAALATQVSATQVLAGQAVSAQGAPASAPSTPVTAPAQIRGAVQFDLTSKSTGRTYRIFVSKPGGPPPPGGFPALYVLDGDWMFGTAAFQGAAAPLDGRDAVVVVGIGYPDGNPFLRRNPDLTPSAPVGATLADSEKMFGRVKPGAFGDAEGFHRFLTEELRPIIARDYAGGLGEQSLMGYSLGGLFALHVLFNHPEAYRTYVIGSPSIWWNDREVLKDEPAFVGRVEAGEIAPRILITSDEWEQFPGYEGRPTPGMTVEEAQAEMAKDRMVDNARELAGRLAAIKGKAGYKVQFTLFPHETHLSGAAGATARGVTFVTLR